jgi:hypothetical protein
VRRVIAMAPGLDGLNLDDPAHLLGIHQARAAQDAVRRNGLLSALKGWAYDGSVADVADSLRSVFRGQFTLADVTRTITTDDDGGVFIHNPAGAGTSIVVGGVEYLARAMYGDQLWLLAQDGVSPAILYSGAGFGTPLSYTGTITLASGEARTEGSLVLASDPGRGSYCALFRATSDFNVKVWNRVLESSTGSVTLEDVRAGNGGGGIQAGGATLFMGYGFPFPCIPIHDAGTVDYDDPSSNLSGYGTKWTQVGLIVNDADGPDAVLVKPPDAAALLYEITVATDDDDLQVGGGNGTSVTTKSTYEILRRCPVTDMTPHRGSAAMTGNKAHPNTVYISPQGWNPSLPPGYVPPFDPYSFWESDDPNVFKLFPIEVPTPDHGDPNVGLLSRPEGLRVLKRGEVHSIAGDYPTFAQGLLASGAGCIDRRSIANLSVGGMWAGEDGVYLDAQGRLDDLTEYRTRSGGINRRWRELTADFGYGGDDRCTIGEADGRVLVAITTNGGTDSATFAYDVKDQAWSCEVTHHAARYFFSSKVPDEAEKLLWVDDDHQGRVMDSAPALNGSGLARNGDGTSPEFRYESGLGLGQAAGIEGEVLVGDLNVHANVYDDSSAATTLTASVFHAGGVRAPAAGETKVLDAVAADTVDRLDRHEWRVNRSGRLVQVILEGDVSAGTNDADTKIEVSEIVLDLFDTAGAT